MSLRSRLVVAIAGLATVAIGVVAATGYFTTRRQLYTEVDRSLTTYSVRLREPGAANVLCGNERFRRGEDSDEREGIPALPGARVQCLNSRGQIVRATEDPLPVDAADRAVAVGTARAAPIHTVSSDDTEYRVLTTAIPGGAVQIARSLGEANAALATLRNRYLLIGLLAVAAAAVAGWLIARRTAAPLAQLTDAAEHIAATGELDATLAPPGRDEVGRLAGAFATMLAALTHSREQQQRLAQDAGHELRTPLTSLRTNIDTLLRHPEIDDAQRHQIVGDLDAEARELSALTEELLALVTERHAEEPDERVDLADLVHRAVDRASRRSEHSFVVTAAPCAVVGRPSALLRAIGNLLENAAKFSPPGTPIEITETTGVVTVRDHGPGIAPEDLPHVFDRFYRSDAARALPGSGLGLSIVAQVAADHGGRVSATNAPDGGAVITLELPPAGPVVVGAPAPSDA